jgi:hypothetical protein
MQMMAYEAEQEAAQQNAPQANENTHQADGTPNF